MIGPYAGEELDLFVHARHWKAYWSAQVRPFLGAEVLEVGAGLGANTGLLHGGMPGRWVCLEPDPALAARISPFVPADPPARTVEIVTGTVDDLPADDRFDSVLYIDVLEHIEDDAAELLRAAARTRTGGTIVVLAPAHPVLFSAFDRAVGHYRRYTRASLQAVAPPGAVIERLAYLDSAGTLISFANRALLRAAVPTLGEVLAWDRLVVPLSRILDPVLSFRLGKSILAVWRVT